jgi:homoserine O-succinyltransferase
MRAPGEGTVRIGLINNMPDAAFDASARQFTALVERALYPRPCSLGCFTMPGIARGAGIAGRHPSADQLRDWPLDLLIVSGATPLHADLRSETYWPALTSIVDRAVSPTRPCCTSTAYGASACPKNARAYMHRPSIMPIPLHLA